jgi:hypothetical protein
METRGMEMQQVLQAHCCIALSGCRCGGNKKWDLQASRLTCAMYNSCFWYPRVWQSPQVLVLEHPMVLLTRASPVTWSLWLP